MFYGIDLSTTGILWTKPMPPDKFPELFTANDRDALMKAVRLGWDEPLANSLRERLQRIRRILPWEYVIENARDFNVTLYVSDDTVCHCDRPLEDPRKYCSFHVHNGIAELRDGANPIILDAVGEPRFRMPIRWEDSDNTVPLPSPDHRELLLGTPVMYWRSYCLETEDDAPFKGIRFTAFPFCDEANLCYPELLFADGYRDLEEWDDTHEEFGTGSIVRMVKGGRFDWETSF